MNVLKSFFIDIGLYPKLLKITGNFSTSIKPEFDALFEKYKGLSKEKIGKPSYSDFLKWKYGRGAKPEEYFNYCLWRWSWQDEIPWMLESQRRVVLKKFNPPKLYTLLNSKIICANLFQQYFKRDIFLYDNTLDESQNRAIFDAFISRCHGVCFCKDEFGLKGHGVEKIILTDSSETMALFHRTQKGNIVLEESLRQHADMAKLNATSVNTLRVLSSMKNGKVQIRYCLVRMGRAGSDVDNAGSGGVFAPISLEMFEISGIARNYVLDEYSCHPDSNIPMVGYKIPVNKSNLEELIEELNEVLRKEGILNAVVGWDIAVKENGDLAMIEGNASADIRISQIAFQIALGEIYTEL